MKCKDILIDNKLGLHARASAKFVQLASEYNSDISLSRNGKMVNGKSIMGIMMLAAAKGTRLELCANGTDEANAVTALSGLVGDLFGEGE
ncbi:MAG: HPr family phosphocarrier protein [Acidiferrobacterales bacterium]